MNRCVLLLLTFGLLLAAADDLGTVKGEPNPEKRSEKALALAGQQMDAAVKAYGAGHADEAIGSAEALLASVRYALESLAASGKSPHGSKYYKRAELRTRDLARRLSDFSESASYEDRPRFEKIRDQVLAIHDRLLEQILSRKKK